MASHPWVSPHHKWIPKLEVLPSLGKKPWDRQYAEPHQAKPFLSCSTCVRHSKGSHQNCHQWLCGSHQHVPRHPSTFDEMHLRRPMALFHCSPLRLPGHHFHGANHRLECKCAKCYHTIIQSIPLPKRMVVLSPIQSWTSSSSTKFSGSAELSPSKITYGRENTVNSSMSELKPSQWSSRHPPKSAKPWALFW